jgi:hypothetical protein
MGGPGRIETDAGVDGGARADRNRQRAGRPAAEWVS